MTDDTYPVAPTPDHADADDDDIRATDEHDAVDDRISPEELYRRVQAALDKYKPVLMAIPGVVGVGIGYATVDGHPTSEIALIVMVDHKRDDNDLSDEARIPPRVNGVRVDVQEMGMFTAF